MEFKSTFLVPMQEFLLIVHSDVPTQSPPFPFLILGIVLKAWRLFYLFSSLLDTLIKMFSNNKHFDINATDTGIKYMFISIVDVTEDISLKSCSSSTVTGTSESQLFAEDRSDKSQYIANTVIKVD